MEAGLEELKAGTGDSDTRVMNWNTVSGAIAFFGDDPESDAMDYVIEHDIMSAITLECRKRPLDNNVLASLVRAATSINLSQKNAEKISASTDYISALMDVVQTLAPAENGAFAFAALANMALNPISHKNLLACGGLEMALGLLHYLDGTETHEIDVGLTSATFICRVVGKEESGPGPDSIKSNAKVSFLLFFFSK